MNDDKPSLPVSLTAGAAVFGALGWLAWLGTAAFLRNSGPGDTEIVVHVLYAGVALLLAAVVGAATARNPFEALSALVAAFRGLVRR